MCDLVALSGLTMTSFSLDFRNPLVTGFVCPDHATRQWITRILAVLRLVGLMARGVPGFDVALRKA